MLDDTASDNGAHRSFDQVQAMLRQFPLTAPTAVFVAHNAGLVYRVDGLEGAFMLKLDQRVGEGPNQGTEQIEQGMHWLAEMSARTAMVVQTPVRTVAGRYVCTADGTNATLQRWVEGRTPQGDFTAAQLHDIGRTMAQLHNDSAAHPAQTSAPAIRHDIQSVWAAVAFMRRTLVPQIVTPDRWRTLEQAVERIVALMDDLGTESTAWGAVHGDIHHDNVLLAGDEVRLIDWTPVRLAHYWYDLGVTMYHIYYQQPHMRQALLDGYLTTRTAPADHIRTVETMFLFAAIDNIAWNCAVPAQVATALFGRNVAQLIDVFAASLVADRTFLFAEA